MRSGWRRWIRNSHKCYLKKRKSTSLQFHSQETEAGLRVQSQSRHVKTLERKEGRDGPKEEREERERERERKRDR